MNGNIGQKNLTTGTIKEADNSMKREARKPITHSRALPRSSTTFRSIKRFSQFLYSNQVRLGVVASFRLDPGYVIEYLAVNYDGGSWWLKTCRRKRRFNLA